MNKPIIIAAMAVVIGLTGGYSGAEEMKFPKTEAEIIESLSIGTDQQRSGTRGLTRGIQTRGVGGITKPLGPLKVGALINFDIDSDTIKPESYDLLDNFGKALNSGLADTRVIIAGHTDSSGSATYNDALSVKRARAVADFLIVRHQIADSRLIVQGLGESEPIADNRTPEGRALNRRVEFIRK